MGKSEADAGYTAVFSSIPRLILCVSECVCLKAGMYSERHIHLHAHTNTLTHTHTDALSVFLSSLPPSTVSPGWHRNRGKSMCFCSAADFILKQEI